MLVIYLNGKSQCKNTSYRLHPNIYSIRSWLHFQNVIFLENPRGIIVVQIFEILTLPFEILTSLLFIKQHSLFYIFDNFSLLSSTRCIKFRFECNRLAIARILKLLYYAQLYLRALDYLEYECTGKASHSLAYPRAIIEQFASSASFQARGPL